MAIRQPLSTGTSESSIIFYNGGHNHDGISSALIATAKYSIYDFTTDFVGTDLRQSVQSENFRKFTNVVSDIVKTSVLGPSGITLSPNQVRAENISAGAVTATALAANIVLVNNVILSNNYVAGVSGWAISSNGTAEFANTSIRGTIEADSLSTTSLTISNTGAITTSSGNFEVDASGNLYANNAEIYGEINASLGSIGAWIIDADGIYNVGAGGRSVALYPAIGSTSEAVFEVDFGGYAARIAAGIISVSAPGASTFMGAGTFQATTNIAVGAYIAIDEDNRHYAYSIRPITTGAQPTYVDITGSGWKYNATNLTHDGYPMAFGWRNSGGRLTFVVNNDANVSGEITHTITSDRRVKDNIRSISISVLDNFYSINTYEFDWNEKAPQWLQDRSHGVGVIADELKTLYPEAVIDDNAYEGWVHRYSEHPEGFSLEEMEKFGSDYYEFVPGEGVWQKPRYASVDYTVLIPHLISAVHDLNNRVKELESEV